MPWKIEVVWCEGNAMQLLRWWLIHNYAGNIRSPHDDTPLCHQRQVIYTSDIVGRFDAFYRPSHSVSYQICTSFYCVLFSLHTHLFILGFLLLLTRWMWSIYRIWVSIMSVKSFRAKYVAFFREPSPQTICVSFVMIWLVFLPQIYIRNRLPWAMRKLANFRDMSC